MSTEVCQLLNINPINYWLYNDDVLTNCVAVLIITIHLDSMNNCATRAFSVYRIVATKCPIVFSRSVSIIWSRSIFDFETFFRLVATSTDDFVRPSVVSHKLPIATRRTCLLHKQIFHSMKNVKKIIIIFHGRRGCKLIYAV